MKKRMRKAAAVLLTAAVVAAMTAGCRKSNAGGDEREAQNGDNTINILFDGAKEKGWDEIYARYLEQAKDALDTELNITWVEPADYKEKLNLIMMGGDNYDLVFDAPWCHLKDLAADHYYADLSSYFNNDEYPGLKKAFLEQVMKNNRWYGSQCYIPLMRTYGTGIPVVHYRKDWAERWGIGTDGQIESMEDLKAYWDKAKENSVLPLSVSDTRGFYQLLSYDKDLTKAGIWSLNTGGFTFYMYIKDNKVRAMAAEGSGDEAFKDFPAPFNCDFGEKRYDTFAEWQKTGYISPDSMTIKDADTPFYAGEAASEIGTLDDTTKILTKFKAVFSESGI